MLYAFSLQMMCMMYVYAFLLQRGCAKAVSFFSLYPQRPCNRFVCKIDACTFLPHWMLPQTPLPLCARVMNSTMSSGIDSVMMAARLPVYCGRAHVQMAVPEKSRHTWVSSDCQLVHTLPAGLLPFFHLFLESKFGASTSADA